MVFKVTITNGVIIYVQPLGSIIFPMVFKQKIIASDVFQWLSIIGPAMRLYRCIAEVYQGSYSTYPGEHNMIAWYRGAKTLDALPLIF